MNYNDIILFMYFLQENKALHEYINACRESSSVPKSPETVREALLNLLPDSFVNSNFSWINSSSGCKYWNNIHNKWNAYYKERKDIGVPRGEYLTVDCNDVFRMLPPEAFIQDVEACYIPSNYQVLKFKFIQDKDSCYKLSNVKNRYYFFNNSPFASNNKILKELGIKIEDLANAFPLSSRNINIETYWRNTYGSAAPEFISPQALYDCMKYLYKYDDGDRLPIQMWDTIERPFNDYNTIKKSVEPVNSTPVSEVFPNLITDAVTSRDFTIKIDSSFRTSADNKLLEELKSYGSSICYESPLTPGECIETKAYKAKTKSSKHIIL